MSEVMMAIGDIVFAVDGAAYQQLVTATPMRWETQERIGRAPALQFLGPGVETIELEGVIYPGFLRGTAQSVDDMRALALIGEPVELIDGQGTAWGRYAVEEVTDTFSFLHSNGTPRKITFTLRLKAYGEDDEAGAEVFGDASTFDPDAVPENVAELMSVDRYDDPALTSGGNSGSFGVLEALTLGRMAQVAFAGDLQGQVGGSLGLVLADDGSVILTGEGGVGVGLDGVGRVGLTKSQSVTLGNLSGGNDGDGGEGGGGA